MFPWASDTNAGIDSYIAMYQVNAGQHANFKILVSGTSRSSMASTVNEVFKNVYGFKISLQNLGASAVYASAAIRYRVVG